MCLVSPGGFKPALRLQWEALCSLSLHLWIRTWSEGNKTNSFARITYISDISKAQWRAAGHRRAGGRHRAALLRPATWRRSVPLTPRRHALFHRRPGAAAAADNGVPAIATERPRDGDGASGARPGWGGRRARGGGRGRDGDPLLPRGPRRGRAAEGAARQQVGSGAPLLSSIARAKIWGLTVSPPGPG